MTGQDKKEYSPISGNVKRGAQVEAQLMPMLEAAMAEMLAKIVAKPRN